MTENKKPIETQTFAPVRPFNNLADYSYKFTAWVQETADKIEKAVCEIVFPGPTDEMLAGLQDQAAFKFMKERYDIDPRAVFNACIGRLGTGPNYDKAESLAAVPAAHEAAQKLADEYKVGQRATGTSTKVDKAELAKLKAAQAELDQLETIRTALGQTKEEFQAYLTKLAAKKAGK